MATVYEWRGAFTNQEVNALHAEAFSTRVFDESEWNWVELVQRHSLGWVVARRDLELMGFVNVLWDGLVHAWLQDTMVAAEARGQGVGTELVKHARDGAKAAGCEYLHVDFEDYLRPFYFGACGFAPTNAGLLSLDLPTAKDVGRSGSACLSAGEPVYRHEDHGSASLESSGGQRSLRYGGVSQLCFGLVDLLTECRRRGGKGGR
jgi:GNAT superfamily N-acetyltransferase